MADLTLYDWAQDETCIALMEKVSSILDGCGFLHHYYEGPNSYSHSEHGDDHTVALYTFRERVGCSAAREDDCMFSVRVAAWLFGQDSQNTDQLSNYIAVQEILIENDIDCFHDGKVNGNWLTVYGSLTPLV